MCPNICLIHGKTIQSDDHKSPTSFFPSLFLIRATSGIVTALCTRHREDMLSELQPQHCMHLKSLNCPYFSLICTAFLQIFLGYNLLAWRSMELNSDKRYQPCYLHVFSPLCWFFLFSLGIITFLRLLDTILEVNAMEQIKVCLEKNQNMLPCLFTTFRVGSRDFLLFIKLYSCVTGWWHIIYAKNIRIVGRKQPILTKEVYVGLKKEYAILVFVCYFM